MSNLVILLIALVLRLDTLWNKLPDRPMDMTKEAAIALVDQLDSYYPDNVAGVNLYFDSISGAPKGWIGATASGRSGCTNSMVLNVNMRYSVHPFYNTPMWVSTIAHELYHTEQGTLCLMPEGTVEFAASMASNVALYNAYKDGNKDAYYGLLYGLRRELALAAADLLLQEDKDPQEYLFNKMKLSEQEEAYFDSRTRDPARLKSQGSLYWTALATALLTDEDGLFSGGAFIEEVDASGLISWLNRIQVPRRPARAKGRYGR